MLRVHAALIVACLGLQRPGKAAAQAAAPPLDSLQLVRRATVVLDSAQSGRDRIALQVTEFRRRGQSVVITLLPVRLMLGGGGRVHLTTTGRVLRVELYQ